MGRKSVKRALSSSDDENLFNLSRKRKYGCNKYHLKSSLSEHSKQSCDICDATFNNKLDYLIHNASHIIIPLKKCDISSHNTQDITSNKKLRNKVASSKKGDHKKETLNPFTSICKVNIEKVNPIPETNILRDILNDCKVIVNNDVDLLSNIQIESVKTVPDLNGYGVQSTSEDSQDAGSTLNCDTISISSTEDLDTNNEIMGSINNIHEKDKGYKTYKKTDYRDAEKNLSELENTNTNIEPKKNGIKIKLKELFEREPNKEWPDCIPFEELIKPGLYRCEFCYKNFANRFNMFEHQACHLKITRSRNCIKCYTGYATSQIIPLCTKCHKQDAKKIKNNSIKQLCDICCMGIKSRYFRSNKYIKIIKHVYLETLSGTAAHHQCDSCGNMCFELKVIRTEVITKEIEKTKHTSLVDRIVFENSSKQQKVNSLSNENRLSRITKRIKTLNFLNRF